MISQKHIAKAQDSEAESRIDYLADILVLSKHDVIQVIAAHVRFIVAWKPKDAPREEKESAIVLADLVMKKFI